MRHSTACLSLVMVLASMMVAATRVTAVNHATAGLQLQVAVNEPSYVALLPIVVEARLLNRGPDSLTVVRPDTANRSVTAELLRTPGDAAQDGPKVYPHYGPVSPQPPDTISLGAGGNHSFRVALELQPDAAVPAGTYRAILTYRPAAAFPAWQTSPEVRDVVLTVAADLEVAPPRTDLDRRAFERFKLRGGAAVWQVFPRLALTPWVSASGLADAGTLIEHLRRPVTKAQRFLAEHALKRWAGPGPPADPDGMWLAEALAKLARGPLLYDAERFADTVLSPSTRASLDQATAVGDARACLNWRLLADAFPDCVSMDIAALAADYEGTAYGPRLQWLLAAAYRDLGEDERSLSLLQSIMVANPELPWLDDVHWAAIDLLRRLGRDAEAVLLLTAVRTRRQSAERILAAIRARAQGGPG